jgi:hypothetical protein
MIFLDGYKKLKKSNKGFSIRDFFQGSFLLSRPRAIVEIEKS